MTSCVTRRGGGSQDYREYKERQKVQSLMNVQFLLKRLFFISNNERKINEETIIKTLISLWHRGKAHSGQTV